MTGRGNITRRGKGSWRLKFEAGDRDPVTGKRRTRFVTFRGTKREAQTELVRLLAEVAAGTSVDPSRVTVADWLRQWLDGASHLERKTAERYRELMDRQIAPRIGGVLLQRLRPSDVAAWHDALLKEGGPGGRPLAPRTILQAHRVLSSALSRATTLELLSRNVATMVSPPRIEQVESASLTEAQIQEVLTGLADHRLLPIATVALGTGMRRGEICGLQWGDVDLDGAVLKVERSLEETDEGLRLKAPKSRHGRRPIALPPSVVETLRGHRVQQAQLRLQLGLGRPEPADFVFAELNGDPIPPERISRQWRRAADGLGLLRVNFHALRHTHASALIAAGLDLVSISRRLGHASPTITLNVYSHKFRSTDAAAAQAIEAAIRRR